MDADKLLGLFPLIHVWQLSLLRRDLAPARPEAIYYSSQPSEPLKGFRLSCLILELLEGFRSKNVPKITLLVPFPTSSLPFCIISYIQPAVLYHFLHPVCRFERFLVGHRKIIQNPLVFEGFRKGRHPSKPYGFSTILLDEAWGPW